MSEIVSSIPCGLKFVLMEMVNTSHAVMRQRKATRVAKLHDEVTISASLTLGFHSDVLHIAVGLDSRVIVINKFAEDSTITQRMVGSY